MLGKCEQFATFNGNLSKQLMAVEMNLDCHSAISYCVTLPTFPVADY